MSDTKPYEVTVPMTHKGTRFDIGAKLELTDEEAANYQNLVKAADVEPETEAEGEEAAGGEPEGEGAGDAGDSGSSEESDAEPEGGEPQEGDSEGSSEEQEGN